MLATDKIKKFTYLIGDDGVSQLYYTCISQSDWLRESDCSSYNLYPQGHASVQKEAVLN